MGASLLQSLDNARWSSLTYAIGQGTCALVLGPDAMTGTIDGRELSAHVAHATYLKEQMGDEGRHLDETRPWTVAEAAVALNDASTLLAWTAEFFQQFRCDDRVLASLAAMSFPLVINASPGLWVEAAFGREHSNLLTEHYDRTAPAKIDFPDPSVGAPVLYHLYGTLENPQSLVLTDNDRLDFVESVLSGCPGLPAKLRTFLSDRRNSFLFVGCELRQWPLQLLIHMLGRGANRMNKSLALERPGGEPDQHLLDFYQRQHKINFVYGDLAPFVEELERRLRPHATSAAAPAPVPANAVMGPPPDAPVVFICHASEDREAARRIAEQLKAAGLNTWLDRDDLVGGDEYDELIRHAIKQEVDFVVVLQSANLRNKDGAFVNKEIRWAMERRLEFRRNFLIPAWIDQESNCLPEFHELIHIDVSASGGELIRAILRDLDKQHRGAR